MNVIEIDAASNNGVDNIREIIDEVQYSPTEGRYKVYIIDEVHMLSAGAFNALLKTLEEPPSYVMFILATTEAHKIPITILSRCQRYDFKRISIDTIAARLQDLMEREGHEVEEKALRYVAKAGDGSMRDSLSLLDQCLAFHFGNKLTYDNVLEVLGAVDTEVFTRLYRAIRQGDMGDCLDLLEEISTDGRDLAQFAVDVTWYLRNLLLLATSEAGAERIDVSSDQLEVMREDANQSDPESLMRYIRVFSELSGQLRYASQKRVLLEIALIKLCKPEMEMGYDSLVERVKNLEAELERSLQLIRSGALVPAAGAGNPENSMNPAVGNGGADPVGAPNGGNAGLPEVPANLEKAIPEDLKVVAKNWSKILSELPGLLKTMIRAAKPSVEGSTLVLVFNDPFDKASVDSEQHMHDLKQAVNRCAGKDVEIRTVCQERGRGAEKEWVDLTRVIKAEIEYID